MRIEWQYTEECRVCGKAMHQRVVNEPTPKYFGLCAACKRAGETPPVPPTGNQAAQDARNAAGG